MRRRTWWAPPDLASLLTLYGTLPGARLVAGNTEVGIEQRFKGVAETHLLSPVNARELFVCADGAEAMIARARRSTTCRRCALPPPPPPRTGRAATRQRWRCACGAARAIAAMLRWFASTQIRNVACLGGNLATASPISDMNPVLAACGARRSRLPRRRRTAS